MRTTQLIEALKHLPCEDCGQTFITAAMDFDHDPELGQKLFGIANRATKPFMEVAAELEKCSIVCANCHRARTEQRRRLALLRDHGAGRFPAMTNAITAIMVANGNPEEGMTVMDVQSAMSTKDDRYLRAVLNARFDIVPGTGTHHIFNPRRYRPRSLD